MKTSISWMVLHRANSYYIFHTMISFAECHGSWLMYSIKTLHSNSNLCRFITYARVASIVEIIAITCFSRLVMHNLYIVNNNTDFICWWTRSRHSAAKSMSKLKMLFYAFRERNKIWTYLPYNCVANLNKTRY